MLATCLKSTRREYMVVKSLRRFSGAELADQSIETENNITRFHLCIIAKVYIWRQEKYHPSTGSFFMACYTNYSLLQLIIFKKSTTDSHIGNSYPADFITRHISCSHLERARKSLPQSFLIFKS